MIRTDRPNREQRRYLPARELTYRWMSLSRIVRLQVQEFGHDEVADGIVHRRGEERDAPV